MKITLSVNGDEHTVEANPITRLLDVLRVQLRLTGTKEGCGEGECGACTVLLDDTPVNACLIPVAQAMGRALVTVEALAQDPVGKAVQEALVECGGTQCGFCTPGIALSATATLRHNLDAPRTELREGVAGNLCRCTGYHLIIDAVELAAQRLRASKVR